MGVAYVSGAVQEKLEPMYYMQCRSGFKYKILLIANCEFLYKTRSKESQIKEYTMNNVTYDLTMFACDPKHGCIIDIMHARSTCMHVQPSIVE